jgi:hypothetical protein
MASGSTTAVDDNSKHTTTLMNQLEDLDFADCRDVSVYEKLTKIYQGTFGSVITYCLLGQLVALELVHFSCSLVIPVYCST